MTGFRVVGLDMQNLYKPNGIVNSKTVVDRAIDVRLGVYHASTLLTLQRGRGGAIHSEMAWDSPQSRHWVSGNWAPQ